MRLSMIGKGLRNLFKAVTYIFRDREAERSVNSGECIVTKVWNGTKTSNNIGLLAHIQRHEWVLPLVKGVSFILVFERRAEEPLGRP